MRITADRLTPAEIQIGSDEAVACGDPDRWKDPHGKVVVSQ